MFPINNNYNIMSSQTASLRTASSQTAGRGFARYNKIAFAGGENTLPPEDIILKKTPLFDNNENFMDEVEFNYIHQGNFDKFINNHKFRKKFVGRLWFKLSPLNILEEKAKGVFADRVFADRVSTDREKVIITTTLKEGSPEYIYLLKLKEIYTILHENSAACEGWDLNKLNPEQKNIILKEANDFNISYFHYKEYVNLDRFHDFYNISMSPQGVKFYDLLQESTKFSPVYKKLEEYGFNIEELNENDASSAKLLTEVFNYYFTTACNSIDIPKLSYEAQTRLFELHAGIYSKETTSPAEKQLPSMDTISDFIKFYKESLVEISFEQFKGNDPTGNPVSNYFADIDERFQTREDTQYMLMGLQALNDASGQDYVLSQETENGFILPFMQKGSIGEFMLFNKSSLNKAGCFHTGCSRTGCSRTGINTNDFIPVLNRRTGKKHFIKKQDLIAKGKEVESLMRKVLSPFNTLVDETDVLLMSIFNSAAPTKALFAADEKCKEKYGTGVITGAIRAIAFTGLSGKRLPEITDETQFKLDLFKIAEHRLTEDKAELNEHAHYLMITNRLYLDTSFIEGEPTLENIHKSLACTKEAPFLYKGRDNKLEFIKVSTDKIDKRIMREIAFSILDLDQNKVALTAHADALISRVRDAGSIEILASDSIAGGVDGVFVKARMVHLHCMLNLLLAPMFFANLTTPEARSALIDEFTATMEKGSEYDIACYVGFNLRMFHGVPKNMTLLAQRGFNGAKKLTLEVKKNDFVVKIDGKPCADPELINVFLRAIAENKLTLSSVEVQELKTKLAEFANIAAMKPRADKPHEIKSKPSDKNKDDNQTPKSQPQSARTQTTILAVTPESARFPVRIDESKTPASASNLRMSQVPPNQSNFVPASVAQGIKYKEPYTAKPPTEDLVLEAKSEAIEYLNKAFEELKVLRDGDAFTLKVFVIFYNVSFETINKFLKIELYYKHEQNKTCLLQMKERLINEYYANLLIDKISNRLLGNSDIMRLLSEFIELAPKEIFEHPSIKDAFINIFNKMLNNYKEDHKDTLPGLYYSLTTRLGKEKTAELFVDCISGKAQAPQPQYSRIMGGLIKKLAESDDIIVEINGGIVKVVFDKKQNQPNHTPPSATSASGSGGPDEKSQPSLLKAVDVVTQTGKKLGAALDKISKPQAEAVTPDGTLIPMGAKKPDTTKPSAPQTEKQPAMKMDSFANGKSPLVQFRIEVSELLEKSRSFLAQSELLVFDLKEFLDDCDKIYKEVKKAIEQEKDETVRTSLKFIKETIIKKVYGEILNNIPKLHNDKRANFLINLLEMVSDEIFKEHLICFRFLVDEYIFKRINLLDTFKEKGSLSIEELLCYLSDCNESFKVLESLININLRKNNFIEQSKLSLNRKSLVTYYADILNRIRTQYKSDIEIERCVLANIPSEILKEKCILKLITGISGGKLTNIQEKILSIIRHDSKSPITSMLGHANIILNSIDKSKYSQLYTNTKLILDKIYDLYLKFDAFFSKDSNYFTETNFESQLKEKFQILNTLLDELGIIIKKTNFSEICDSKDMSYNIKSLKDSVVKIKQEFDRVEDFLKLDKKFIVNNTNKLNFTDFVEEFLREFLHREINEKFITTKTEIPENIIVWANDLALTSILRNLFENTIKIFEKDTTKEYKEYRITIRAEENAAAGVTKIFIEDNGPGIHASRKESIFEGDSTTGGGFGLQRCRELVKAHNGEIYEDGHFGRGACFVIELPLDKNKNAHTSPQDVQNGGANAVPRIKPDSVSSAHHTQSATQKPFKPENRVFDNKAPATAEYPQTPPERKHYPGMREDEAGPKITERVIYTFKNGRVKLHKNELQFILALKENPHADVKELAKKHAVASPADTLNKLKNANWRTRTDLALELRFKDVAELLAIIKRGLDAFRKKPAKNSNSESALSSSGKIYYSTRSPKPPEKLPKNLQQFYEMIEANVKRIASKYRVPIAIAGAQAIMIHKDNTIEIHPNFITKLLNGGASAEEISSQITRVIATYNKQITKNENGESNDIVKIPSVIPSKTVKQGAIDGIPIIMRERANPKSSTITPGSSIDTFNTAKEEVFGWHKGQSVPAPIRPEDASSGKAKLHTPKPEIRSGDIPKPTNYGTIVFKVKEEDIELSQKEIELLKDSSKGMHVSKELWDIIANFIKNEKNIDLNEALNKIFKIVTDASIPTKEKDKLAKVLCFDTRDELSAKLVILLKQESAEKPPAVKPQAVKLQAVKPQAVRLQAQNVESLTQAGDEFTPIRYQIPSPIASFYSYIAITANNILELKIYLNCKGNLEKTTLRYNEMRSQKNPKSISDIKKEIELIKTKYERLPDNLKQNLAEQLEISKEELEKSLGIETDKLKKNYVITGLDGNIIYKAGNKTIKIPGIYIEILKIYKKNSKDIIETAKESAKILQTDVEKAKEEILDIKSACRKLIQKYPEIKTILIEKLSQALDAPVDEIMLDWLLLPETKIKLQKPVNDLFHDPLHPGRDRRWLHRDEEKGITEPERKAVFFSEKENLVKQLKNTAISLNERLELINKKLRELYQEEFGNLLKKCDELEEIFNNEPLLLKQLYEKWGYDYINNATEYVLENKANELIDEMLSQISQVKKEIKLLASSSQKLYLELRDALPEKEQLFSDEKANICDNIILWTVSQNNKKILKKLLNTLPLQSLKKIEKAGILININETQKVKEGGYCPISKIIKINNFYEIDPTRFKAIFFHELFHAVKYNIELFDSELKRIYNVMYKIIETKCESEKMNPYLFKSEKISSFLREILGFSNETEMFYYEDCIAALFAVYCTENFKLSGDSKPAKERFITEEGTLFDLIKQFHNKLFSE